MGFFQNILNSIYSPQFYKNDIPQKSMGQAFGYYFLLALLLTAISTTALIIPVSQGVTELKEKVIPQLINKYPKNLEVRIKNGQVSTNAKEPYVIPMPPGADPKLKNFLVIDTKHDFSFSLFDTYDTLIVLTKDYIYYQDMDKGEIRGSNLSEVKDLTVSKTVLQNLIQQFSFLFTLLTPLILFFAFIGVYLVFTFRLISAALLALVVMWLMKLVKTQLSYENAFKTVLFAITAGLLVETFFSITRSVLHVDGFPYMTSIITISIIFLNYKLKK